MVFDNRTATTLKADEYPKCRTCKRVLYAKFFKADGNDHKWKGDLLAIAGYCQDVDLVNDRYTPDKEVPNGGDTSTFQVARALTCGVCGSRVLVMFNWNHTARKWKGLRGICAGQPGCRRDAPPAGDPIAAAEQASVEESTTEQKIELPQEEQHE